MFRKDESIKTAHLFHEMILALTGIDTLFTAKDPTIPDYNKALLEPSEADLMQRILKFGKNYGEIKEYIYSINCQQFKEDSKVGLYVLSFAEALHQATYPYWNSVVALEEELTQDRECSLHFVWSKIYVHNDLLTGLKRIVTDVKQQNLSGCMLLEYLQDSLYSSVGLMRSAVQLILEALNEIFYHQISSWMIYGQLVDSYDEFFIKENLACSDWCTPFEKFSINPVMLPKFVSQSCAERILNIGQTVLFLRSNPYTTNCSEIIDSRTEICITENGIMGDKEKEIQKKIQEIQSISIWNDGGVMDRLVAEVSSCATQQLWSLALENARLVDQLKLVKEFFLLGRGELFHEFVMQIDRTFPKGLAATNETTIDSDMNLILQEAAQKIHVKEDFFQRFKLEFKKVPDDKIMDLGGEWANVTVKYDIPWPLQLLFTPGVLMSYNKIFQFLLRLKKIQVKLVSCWLFEKTKMFNFHRYEDNVRRRVLHRNLWFLINNLQYYLHVDVLESQFTIFETALKNSRDFEEIQNAHTIFLQNLVAQLFIYDETGQNTSKISINRSMNKILKICEEYCFEVEVHEDREIEEAKIKCMLLRFESCVECLLKVLSGFSSQECYPGSQYLSQFLLRLDYNSFFTQQLSSDMVMIYL